MNAMQLRGGIVLFLISWSSYIDEAHSWYSFGGGNKALDALIRPRSSVSWLFSSAPDLDEMKTRDIQAELRERGESFSDCFDRESLVKKLLSSRAKGDADDGDGDVVASDDSPASSSSPAQQEDDVLRTEEETPRSNRFDRQSVLSELRSLRVSELRSRLGERNIRWAGMLEKEELVVALANAMETAANFSVSGALVPGTVTDITDEQLSLELSSSSSSTLGTPLVLDVYATWCGPCQMVAPELKAVATDYGDKVRFAKMDSDRYPDWSRKLQVGGLPTLVAFGPDGTELDRMEGALDRNGLTQFITRATSVSPS